jgi:hypothetical protein
VLALGVSGWFAVGSIVLPEPVGAASPASAPSNAGWIRDTVNVLNIFLPDGASDYYISGFGTEHGARTVISGTVPNARYWSFTMYPGAGGGVDTHVHDTQIRRSRDHYRVTLAASCRGIGGTCVDTTPTGTSGFVVMRVYVPVDLNGAGTGGVPLPTLTYQRAGGQDISLAGAAGTSSQATALNFLRQLHGQLPAALSRPYPAPAPVLTPIETPPPVAKVTPARGEFANPDNLYDHMAFSTARGDLVVTSVSPTYQADGFKAVNNLGRAAAASPQVRYWSVCVTLTGRATGACLHDEQVHTAANGTFTIIVSPTCPVAGYRNCLIAGPEEIQVSLAFRNLLPSSRFAPHAFRGRYALHGTYVARPG